MKNLKVLFLCLVLVLLAGPVFAAGSCVPLSIMRTVVYRGLDKPYGIPYICTSDAADASVTPFTLDGLTGFLSAVEVDFGTAAPTSVAVSVKTSLGNEIFPTGTLQASDYVPTDAPYPFANGLTVAPTFVGNSKTAIVVLYVF